MMDELFYVVENWKIKGVPEYNKNGLNATFKIHRLYLKLTFQNENRQTR